MRVRFWFALTVSGGMWAYCLVAHVSITFGWDAPPAAPPVVPAGAGLLLAAWAFWPHRSDLGAEIAPTRPMTVFWVSCVLCGMWPMAVGPGVEGTGFVAGGVAGGPEGGRYLHSHSRFIRPITEDEYRRVERWGQIQSTATAVVCAGVGPMLLLLLRRGLRDAEPGAAGDGSGAITTLQPCI